MALTDWQFEVDPPSERDGAWWFGVRGTQCWSWGPFPTHQLAIAEELRVFQRWNAAARARGGWAWKATPRRWVVTAPPEVPVAGMPMSRAACTRHHSTG